MEDFFDNELAKRFEEMIENNEEYYFDTDDLQDIIIFYLEVGDISFAEKATDYALKLHPNSVDIKTKKLEVLLEREEYTEAKNLIDELKEFSNASIDFIICCAKYYSNLGNPKKSISYCEKALEFQEEENFLHNFIGDELVNLGDPFGALKHYQKALKHEPTDDYALTNCMNCFSELNRHQEAIDFLNHYLDEFPFSEMAWYEYAQFHQNRKNYEEAIRGYDFLLAINDGGTGTYSNKASCYEALGQYEKAISLYEEMLEKEYTKAYTFYKIGLCYKALEQLVSALTAFQRALIEDPQFYLAMMEQSYIYEEMGGMNEALHFAKEATYLNENNLDYQKRLAFLYIDASRFTESLSCFQKLVDCEPSKFHNWYAYTEVLMLIGEYEQAVKILNKAITLHHRAELYYQLSNCFFNLDYHDQGVAILEEAISLDATIAEDMQQKYPYIKSEVKKVKTKKGL